jgi:hypothetical protein
MYDYSNDYSSAHKDQGMGDGMAVEINKASVVADDEAWMEFNITIDGDAINIRVSGYADPLNAIKALHLIGQPEQLARVAERYTEAGEG